MKTIIMACCTFLLLAPAANAQKQRNAPSKNDKGVSSTTATINSSDGSSVTVMTPGMANADALKVQSATTNDYPINNGGIIVPDHAYEPAGTAGVGFYGNGTGGSTIGSAPQNGGTGYRPAPLLQQGSLIADKDRRKSTK